SPNAIPPRTSSSGVVANGASPPPRAASKKASSSVLRPISETDWLSQGKRSHHRRFEMAEPLPHRTSSRHRLSSSFESKASSAKAGPSHHSTLSSPPPDPSRGYADELIHQRQRPWPADKERILLAPYSYLLEHPGKDIRKQLIAAFNEWLNVPEGSLVIITRVIGMLHTASLLVDDVEDSSLLRRGVPVAHSIFGTAQTINSANYVYFLALQELTSLPTATSAINIYTQELLNLHRGQGLDLFWRDSLTCPTEAEYLDMVGNKTGGLFRLAVRLMMSESKVDVDCVPLVNTIGLLFQVLDDHLNLHSPSYTQRKGLCEDLTEGKFSFPILHAIRADPQNLTLVNILRQKTTDEEVKKYAIQYMEKMGSFKYSREVMEMLRRRAEEKVSEVEVRVGIAGGDSAKRGAEGVRRILEKM
ncbi:terpenoid synthase, partial [Rhizodiscina lignyota]